MASDRLRIAVLFGGRSAEHDVSVLSATNVMGALEPAKYDAVPVFVTREGRWLLSELRGRRASESRPNGTELCLRAGRAGADAGDPGRGRAA